jgi:hypothetical protein
LSLELDELFYHIELFGTKKFDTNINRDFKEIVELFDNFKIKLYKFGEFVKIYHVEQNPSSSNYTDLSAKFYEDGTEELEIILQKTEAFSKKYLKIDIYFTIAHD